MQLQKNNKLEKKIEDVGWYSKIDFDFVNIVLI